MGEHLPECPKSGCPACRTAALDAAREAVAALGRYAMPEDWLVGVDRKVVLAAIDALKGEQP